MTKDEALKLSLEALQNPWKAGPDGVADAIIAIKEALAQPEQEPVAEVVMAVKPPKASPAWIPFKTVYTSLEWLDSVPVGTKLYPTPPQRTWVGLTNKELADCWETIPELAMRKVEAKLKEKNT